MNFLTIIISAIIMSNAPQQKEEAIFPRCTNKRGDIVETVMPEDVMDDDDELRNQLLQDFEDLKDDTLDYPSEIQ